MDCKGKNRVDERTYRAIYRLLDRVSPLDYNCGELCGAACCGKPEDWYVPGSDSNEEKDYGLYLYPGEEVMHIKDGVRDEQNYLWDVQESDDDDDDLADSWGEEVYFLSCRGPAHCSRKSRPIQCRTFPLAPYIDEDGELSLIYEDADVPYRCPLIDEEIPLNDDFVKATYTVWKHMIRDERIYEIIKADSEGVSE